MLTTQVHTQGQGRNHTPPVSNTSRSYEPYILSLKLFIKHAPHFWDQCDDSRSLTELVAASIDSLSHKYICAILHGLSRRRNVSHLDKYDRRWVETLESLDDCRMRLQVTIRCEQPYRCRTVLCKNGQRRIGKSSHGGIAGNEGRTDLNWTACR